MKTTDVDNREATQEFVIRDFLVGHCMETLTPDRIDKMVEEFMTEIKTGSTSWAFKKE